jgi:hypothetical protein
VTLQDWVFAGWVDSSGFRVSENPKASFQLWQTAID